MVLSKISKQSNFTNPKYLKTENCDYIMSDANRYYHLANNSYFDKYISFWSKTKCLTILLRKINNCLRFYNKPVVKLHVKDPEVHIKYQNLQSFYYTQQWWICSYQFDVSTATIIQWCHFISSLKFNRKLPYL